MHTFFHELYKFGIFCWSTFELARVVLELFLNELVNINYSIYNRIIKLYIEINLFFISFKFILLLI